MKTLKLLFVLLIIAAMATSCEKEGPAGPAGTNGTNGNANVTVYRFGEQILTNIDTEVAFTLPFTGAIAKSSIILPYYLSTLGYWYQVGELGPSSTYLTKYYINPDVDSTYLYVGAKDVDASSYSGPDITWDSVRVFVIPANIFRSAKLGNIDFKNQSEVSAYFDAR